MPVTMRDVFSSHVDKIGYDPGASELVVTWDSGKTSIYTGVPAGVAENVMNSWSVGKALTETVKGQYGHRYAG